MLSFRCQRINAQLFQEATLQTTITFLFQEVWGNNLENSFSTFKGFYEFEQFTKGCFANKLLYGFVT